jgi:uncharacterized membrane protein YfcA
MEIAGYIVSLLIGISLGMIGAGGSILTLPVLVFMFGIDPLAATTYSLFVVGVSSTAALVTKLKQKLVDFKTAFLFGLPSFITVVLTRRFLLPVIPHTFNLDGIIITQSSAMLIVFAGLMIVASLSMIRDKSLEKTKPVASLFSLLLQGATVGLLTGVLGAGGGFIIIPALVLVSKLPMKVAVATSLFIIAVNSLVGLSVDLLQSTHLLNWKILISVTILSLIGTVIGSKLSVLANPVRLKHGFGWFVLLMGTYILFTEAIIV